MKSKEIKRTKRTFESYFLIGIFSFISLMLQGENAPVTTIASFINATPGEQVTVPVTVTKFENIAGLTLALDYDYSKLHFVSGAKNSLLTGTCNIGDIDLGNGFHRLTISWFKSGEGISLPDSSTLVDYVFTFISGTASLTWYDNGPSCVFNDPEANTLNDEPTSNYYFNGVISNSAVDVPGIATSGPTTFFEGGSVTLTSSAGYAYLWSTGDTTSSIVVNTSGSYTVQTINSEGVSSEPSTPTVVTVISAGGTELSYRLNSPTIVNSSVDDYFAFDVQVKADLAVTCLWKGQINLDFNNTTFSSEEIDWIVTLDSLFSVDNSLGHAKYNIDFSISESILNIEIKGDLNAMNLIASENDFVKISNEYQTIISLRGKIISENDVSGIGFNKSLMNGNQFYKLPAAPWNETYAIPNNYDSRDFTDTYVGRIYSFGSWTQIESLDWTKAVNTSVWDNNATILEDVISYASNLRIHESASLIIPENAMMTVLESTEIKSQNGLIIKSDSVGTGSFITSYSAGQGSVVADCYLTTDKWYVLTTPLRDESIKDFLITNSCIKSLDDNTGRRLKDFDSELNVWNNHFTNDEEGNLEHGKGYFLQADSNSLISFNGLLQTGDITIYGAAKKWNCIGNPYTSAITINQGIENTSNFLFENIENLDPSYGAIYIWTQPDLSNGNIGSYTAISNAVEKAEIQLGQAYFVKLNNEKKSVSFNSEMQIHKPKLALKSENSSIQKITLNVSSNPFNSSTIITFKNEMTLGLDPTFDAGLLKGNSDLAVYSRLVENNGVDFAIQALPNNGENNLVIPIGLDFTTGGEVVFSAESFNLPSEYLVLLEDGVNGIITDLSTSDYSVQIADNSTNLERFWIHTSYLTTGVDTEILYNKLKTYVTQNRQLVVRGYLSDHAFAIIYDLQGRMLLSKKLIEGNTNMLNLSGINPGVYLLLVKDRGKASTFKIPVLE